MEFRSFRGLFLEEIRVGASGIRAKACGLAVWGPFSVLVQGLGFRSLGV